MLAFQGVGDMLKPGVFVLVFHKRVVHVGIAKCLLTLVAEYRNVMGGSKRPSFHPIKAVRFDDIRIIPCDIVRARELLPALQEFYQVGQNISLLDLMPDPLVPTTPADPPRPTRRL